jgi:hypothetical protein
MNPAMVAARIKILLADKFEPRRHKVFETLWMCKTTAQVAA